MPRSYCEILKKPNTPPNWRGPNVSRLVKKWWTMPPEWRRGINGLRRKLSWLTGSMIRQGNPLIQAVVDGWTYGQNDETIDRLDWHTDRIMSWLTGWMIRQDNPLIQVVVDGWTYGQNDVMIDRMDDQAGQSFNWSSYGWMDIRTEWCHDWQTQLSAMALTIWIRCTT